MNGYLLQAIGIALWWLGMFTSPSVYAAFAFPGISRNALFAFAVPDILLLTGLSLWVWRRPNRILQAMVLGAFLYGTLWCIATTVLTRGGFLSSSAMVLGSLFNVLLLIGQNAFRASRSDRPAVNLAKTFLQSTCIWTVTLLIFPLAIVHATAPWPPTVESLPLTLGICGFAAFSLLGLWSGATMALRGRGTPLPLDAARQLVTCGPYAYVRNPMAIAGIGQGFCVALALQSGWVAAYVALGMFVWNAVVRPEEERFMENTFGIPYTHYRNAVQCWLPRRSPYQKLAKPPVNP